ncbi:hypothetical protein ACUOFC_37920 [Escherichia sp. TWPC-MK]
MLKYAKNGMFEAIINHESEQIRPLDNAYTDILNKAVKIRITINVISVMTRASTNAPIMNIPPRRVR